MFSDPVFPHDPVFPRDANGNTTGQGTWTYTYDKHNRLTKAYNSGTLKVTYNYNGLGQRVRKAVAGGSTTRYVYGLNGQLLAETSGSGTVQRIYIYLDDTPLALLIGTTQYYIHTDHLGTPKALTTRNGTKVWSATHDPFGKATVNEDPDGNGSKITFNLRFPGQYYDGETGLHYNYFRTYDPSTGRYLESDPIGLIGGLNTYAYASNNPLLFIDPYGLWEMYGNWGGRNWAGGTNTKYGIPHPFAPPKDSLDQCFMVHDFCYDVNENCNTEESPQFRKEERKCDVYLLQCMDRLPSNTTDWPMPPHNPIYGKNHFDPKADQFKRRATWYFNRKWGLTE